MAKRDDEAAKRGEPDELDARIDARIKRALLDHDLVHGHISAEDHAAAQAALEETK